MTDAWRHKYYVCSCGHNYLEHDEIVKHCNRIGCTCMWFVRKKAKDVKTNVDA